MGLFSSEAERRRKQNLKDLEDKRLRFAQMFAEQKIVPENILFTQRDGGFAAVAVAGDEFLLITGPAPGAEEDFSLLRVNRRAPVPSRYGSNRKVLAVFWVLARRAAWALNC